MERYLVEHCAPTLASIKTGNLFSYVYSSLKELNTYIEAWNQCMKSKGVSIRALRVREHTALIYVYRKSFLERDLEQPGAVNFLHDRGYEYTDVEFLVERLKERLEHNHEFPHEIGLFLGYPLGDVIGFVENSGRNCICSGCWKVYQNAAEAIRTFQRFKKCKEVYVRLWSEGKSVWQLTVDVEAGA
ncbi:MAG: DUF3793 family protein [Dorea sp.]|jgi:hypothetical protein|nr:DUF3793 family protein [Dorea sp.]